MIQNRRISIFRILVFSAGVIFLLNQTAEAARLGGGKSFGSRPSYQRSAPAPSPSPTSPQLSPGRSTPQMPGTAPTMSRWGGLLGGMLMGGLIGSLLFGGVQGYGGPGLLDLAILGGGLFLLLRYLRSRRMATESPSAAGSMSFDRGPAQGWGSSSDETPIAAGSAEPAPASIPPGFDTDEFLKGAKAIYTRLQASWDKRDLDDIRQFTAPSVYEEIQRQAQADPQPGKTELLLINPRILEVRDSADQTVASVLYDVMMRESSAETARQVREIWHFSREAGNPKAFWLLEGIQQVEG